MVQNASFTSSTRPQRPSIKSRAYSAPLVPNIATTTATSTTQSPTQPRGHGDIAASSEDEISQDPFFLRYSNSKREFAEGTDITMSPTTPNDELADGQNSPFRTRPRNITTYVASDPSGSQSTPISPTGYFSGVKTPTGQPLQEINVAVLGAPRVGKSTFIQKAFDLTQSPLLSFTRRKMSLDGTIYVVRLIELGYNDLDLDDDQCVCWPDTIDGQPVPTIDGAFTLYDVTNRDSLIQMPETLSELLQTWVWLWFYTDFIRWNIPCRNAISFGCMQMRLFTESSSNRYFSRRCSIANSSWRCQDFSDL